MGSLRTTVETWRVPEKEGKLESRPRAAEEKERKQKAELTIIDVRTPQEYAEGHIIGARNIPLKTLASKLEELTHHKDQEIYLVCAVGGRSHQARVFLNQKGFSKAINVQGGTRGWKAKGYPTK